MAGETDTAKQIRAYQVDQLYTRMPTVSWLTFILAAMLVIILWPVMNHTRLLVWGSATTLIYAARWFLVTRYKKACPGADEIEKWAARFLFGTILGGLAWGAAGYFLFPQDDLAYQIVLILVVAGFASMGVTTLSSVREDIVTFLCLLLIPPFFRLLIAGSKLYLIMAGLVFLYLIGLLLTSRFMTNTYLEMITLRIKSMLQAEKIKAALQEKEVLLKEIHHRVKNNLQTIISLLNLQSGYIRDDQAREVFENSKERVRAIALVHERLYESKDLIRIDFGEYIRGMIKSLYESYSIEPRQVLLKTEIEDVELDIDTLMPLGLLINELVSNALKHAFPAGKKGELYIELMENRQKEKDKKYYYTLIVRDNGCGFPARVNFRKSESLGLLLINTLVKQLHGVIDLDKKDGTTFTVKFNKLKYRKRT